MEKQVENQMAIFSQHGCHRASLIFDTLPSKLCGTTHGIHKHSPCSNIKIAGKILYVSPWYIKISKIKKNYRTYSKYSFLVFYPFFLGDRLLISFHRHHRPNPSDLRWPRRSRTWIGHVLDLLGAPEKMENTCIYCTVYIYIFIYLFIYLFIYITHTYIYIIKDYIMQIYPVDSHFLLGEIMGKQMNQLQQTQDCFQLDSWNALLLVKLTHFHLEALARPLKSHSLSLPLCLSERLETAATSNINE